jgi:flagellin-like hook-associated protein FlgL
VNGQTINGSIIAHTGDNSAAAAAIANDINSTNTEDVRILAGERTVLSRNYTATSVGAKVNIFSDTIAYWEDNNKSLTVTVRGDANTDNNNATSIMDGSVRQSGGAVVYINNKIKDIIQEVDAQLLNAKHNEQHLFTGNTLSFYTGTEVQNSINTPTFTYSALDTDTLDLTVNSAETSIDYIDTNLNSIKSLQSQYVAFSNALEFEIDYIEEALLRNSQTLSKIVDSDVAIETSRLVKSQFLEDAALSMYLKTRMQKRDVMSLYFSQSKVEGQGKFYF